MLTQVRPLIQLLSCCALQRRWWHLMLYRCARSTCKPAKYFLQWWRTGKAILFGVLHALTCEILLIFLNTRCYFVASYPCYADKYTLLIDRLAWEGHRQLKIKLKKPPRTTSSKAPTYFTAICMWVIFSCCNLLVSTWQLLYCFPLFMALSRRGFIEQWCTTTIFENNLN